MLIPVFDLGGVLAHPDDLLDVVASALGTGPEALSEPYWTNRLPYDNGCAPLPYWSAVAEQLGITITPEKARELALLDCAQWLRIRPQALQNLVDLRQAGHEVFLLSNAPALLDYQLRQTAWASVFTGWIVSGVVGVSKPDEGIYRALERLVSRSDVEFAFIDDRPNNVEGAVAAGWHAHQWISDDDTRAWLVELGLLS